MQPEPTTGPATPSSEGIVWNTPNKLSAGRIVLAVASFVTICCGWYLVSLLLFTIASATDWLDGYLARKHNQITQLGRILDPFADKVLICGTFILLGAIDGSFIAAWMAVVVTGRELLVTALRSLIEGKQMDFSAKWAGKWKMVFQCAAMAMSLWRLAAVESGNLTSLAFDNLLIAIVWLSLGFTIYSGWGYVKLATDMLLGDTADS